MTNRRRQRVVEKLVIFDHDVSIETGCNKEWMVEARDLAPIEQISVAGCDEIPDNIYGNSSWQFECRQHNTRFALWEGCSKAAEVFHAGDSASVPSDKAEWLVSTGRAHYPSHKPVVENQIQATLDRTNALMDSMGFPHMNADDLRAIKAPSRGVSKHYAKPADKRLGNDLGISGEDIAEMRKLLGN